MTAPVGATDEQAEEIRQGDVDALDRLRFDAAVFYAALDARRRALGLRWRDVAVQASVSRSMLSRMGVQKLCPDVHGLARLLVWLGDTDLGPYISATAPVRRRSDGRAASDRVDGGIGPGRVMTVEGLA